MKLSFGGGKGPSDTAGMEFVENANDFMFVHDLEGILTWVNPAAEHISGYDRDELIGRHLSELLVESHRDWPTTIVQKLHSGRPVVSQLTLLTKERRQVAFEVLAQFVFDGGRPVAVQGLGRDVAERAQLEREFLHLANHDGLTGLLNRRRLEEELQQQLARAQREPLESALLFLDLDQFKDVNDSVGHAAGDELLRQVANLLKEGLREVDIVARQGGDEFAIVLHRTGVLEAGQTADRILSALRRKEFHAGGQHFKISGSIGIAMIPQDGKTPEELLSNADLAMYKAKEGGRDGHAAFGEDAELQDQVRSRIGLRNQISTALASKAFRLYAQPILDVRSGQISQFELLVRLVDESGSIVEANDFIAAAERFGMIREIDRWVISQAIDLSAACDRAGRPTVLEVNVSGKSVGDDYLLRLIRDKLDEVDADPTRLVFEVTESAAIESIEQAQEFAAELSDIGCSFALDDFGAGVSSFQQLKSLDVDMLKIDGSLIRDLPSSEVDRHLVRAIVEMAAALGKTTVAEYVGDEATLRIVSELGIDYAQGYYVAEPAEATQTILAGKMRELHAGLSGARAA